MRQNTRKLLAGELDIATLSAADLDELRADLAAAFAELDPDPAAGAVPSDGDLAQMDKIAAATERVQAEQDARSSRDAEQAAERARQDEERANRLAGLRQRVAETAPKTDPPTPAPAEPTAAAQGGEGGGQVAELEPVAASGATPATTTTPGLGRLAAGVPDAAKPQPARTATRGVLVASAGVPGLGLGEETDWQKLAVATERKLHMLRNATSEERHLVASLTWERPEGERLRGDDAWHNTAMLDEALSVDAVMGMVEDRGMEALVAAGGICGPSPVDYEVRVDSIQSRPFRDSLPAFQADRGALRFIPPPTLADVGTSASVVWTAANDASPSSPTAKPVQTFTCPTPVEVFVDAIPTRVQFSNMQQRYSPEVVAANTDLAMANAARLAEQNLLSKLSAGSIKTGAGTLVSFTRDWMALLELLATGMRYRHRLPDMYPLRLTSPSWAKAALRTDILRGLDDGAGGQGAGKLALADATMNAMFAARGIVPGWTLDGLGKSTAGATLSAAGSWDYPDQFFAAPATTAALSAAPPDASAGSASAGTWFPTRLAFWLYPEGTWVFLDGGRVDLGVIRDSVLNDTNQYQMFVEPFEGLAKRGYESLQIVVPTRLTGAAIDAVSAFPASAAVF